MVIESILPNQIKWSWYHSFQKTKFYLMISNNAIFPNFKVTKIEHSACFGTPGIDRIKRCNLFHQNEWIFFFFLWTKWAVWFLWAGRDTGRRVIERDKRMRGIIPAWAGWSNNPRKGVNSGTHPHQMKPTPELIIAKGCIVRLRYVQCGIKKRLGIEMKCMEGFQLTCWRLVPTILGLGSMGNACYSKINLSSMGLIWQKTSQLA